MKISVKQTISCALCLLCTTAALAACLPAALPPAPPLVSDAPAVTTGPSTTSTPETTAVPETTVTPQTIALPETTAAPEATTEAPETTTAPAPVLDLATTVFLTFDDGPYRGKTDAVLQILADYGIPATFFTVGMFIDYYPELARRITDEGHLLACHSYSHDYNRIYTTPEAIRADLAEWEKAVEAALGAPPAHRLYRFPGGTTGNTLSVHAQYFDLLAAITDAGYTPFDWTAATNDRYLGGKREEQSMEEYFLESLDFTLSLTRRNPPPPKIILMHDTSDDTVAALPAILDYLIEHGYTFATLDALDTPYIANRRQPDETTATETVVFAPLLP